MGRTMLAGRLGGALLAAGGVLGACNDADDVMTAASASVGATTGTGSGGGGGGSGSDIPCTVWELLAARCHVCHTAGPGPAFLTHADVTGPTTGYKPGMPRYEAMLERMKDGSMPQGGPPATEAEIQVIQDWIDAGVPKRGPSEMCGGGGSGGSGGGLECEPDLTLAPATKFTVPSDAQDTYVCYGIEIAPDADARQLVGFDLQLDNPKVVHHLLLFATEEAEPASFEPCATLKAGWKLVYAWAPGSGAFNLPPEAGFPIDANTAGHYLIQYHYNNPGLMTGQQDQTGIKACSTKRLRPNAADIMAFGATRQIKPIEYDTEATIECTFNVIAQADPYVPVVVFQSWPHMHKIGRQLFGEVQHPSGAPSELANVTKWDFNLQKTYPVEVGIDVGDKVFTRCTWRNDAMTNPACATDPSKCTVTFGEGTENEMCFNFVSYYPRIDPNKFTFFWQTPSVLAKCTQTASPVP
jgi:hypothetical protein